MEKTFGYGIVPTVSLSTHTTFESHWPLVTIETRCWRTERLYLNDASIPALDLHYFPLPKYPVNFRQLQVQ